MLITAPTSASEEGSWFSRTWSAGWPHSAWSSTCSSPSSGRRSS